MRPQLQSHQNVQGMRLRCGSIHDLHFNLSAMCIWQDIEMCGKNAPRLRDPCSFCLEKREKKKRREKILPAPRAT
jgi:hypothetical protein